MTPAAFAGIMGRAYTHMRPWPEADIARTLTLPSTRFLHSDHAGLIARIVADECEILALATDPIAHRTGQASCLVQTLIERAHAENVTKVFLEVAAQNAAARAFYDAQGFAQVGHRKAYYTLRDGTTEDALLLSRPIP